MSEIEELLDEINFLKTGLYKFIEESKGNLQDSYVLSLSRIVNKDIVEYIKHINNI
ncbi:MAG: hypothetical protein ACOYVK_00580 [Bacillota bacterium]